VKLLTYAQLESEKGVAYTRRHLRDLCRDGKFPRPVELSEARIAWVEHEVDAWVESKIAARDAAVALNSEPVAAVPVPVAPDSVLDEQRRPKRLVCRHPASGF
jgi:prophage regulatory protein